MEKTFIFGHKNPDTDSICSAVVMEDLQKKLGIDAEATRLGELNKETSYAFKFLGMEPPRLIDKVEPGSNVILVDHNEFSQSADGIEDANIKMFVDHHRISNFRTKDPVFCFAEPVGCTGTVLYRLYKMNNIEIEPKIASLMLTSIASDTLLFKSPTCTQQDIDVAKELEKIANIDIQEYGMDLLKAGTDLADLTAEQLVNVDAKDFEVNGVNFTIAQINTVDIDEVLKNQDAIEKAINNEIEDRKLDLFVFAITDILNSNSEIIALGNRTDIVEKSYKLENNRAFLEGMVSRKKQILPFISENI